MSTRNVERRKKRRRRKHVKASVKITIFVLIVIASLGGYTGLRIYQNKNAENPYGDIRHQNLADDDSFNLSTANAKYKIFDVGQGEAILIKVGRVEALVDTGTEDKAKDLCKELKNHISGNLDYLIITSPSSGRIGGIKEVTSSFGVNTCIIGEMGEKDADVRALLESCGEVLEGKDMSFDLGENATISVIKPEVSSTDILDQSLATFFSFEKSGFLALSDAGKEEISRVFGKIDKCNVIVLSRYGNESINMSLPQENYGVYTIASTDSKSGDPTEALKDYLRGTVMSTAESGMIEFEADGKSVELIEKEEPEEPEEEEADK